MTMNVTMNGKTGLSKGKKIAIASGIAVVVIGIIVAVVLVITSGVFDKDMKLIIADGTVNIMDTKGNTSPAKSNSTFQSGQIISTSYDGTACIAIDNAKKVWLEGYSRAEFNKQGKTAVINLKKGGVFFEVTERPGEKETYQIKTTSITVNITKAGSGYVYYDPDSDIQTLIVTDGVVSLDAYNSSTGQRKTAEVHGGQKVSIYLYASSKESVKLITADIYPKTLPEFPLRVIAKNSNLLKNICKYNSWDESELQYYIDHLPGMNKET